MESGVRPLRYSCSINAHDPHAFVQALEAGAMPIDPPGGSTDHCISRPEQRFLSQLTMIAFEMARDFRKAMTSRRSKWSWLGERL